MTGNIPVDVFIISISSGGTQFVCFVILLEILIFFWAFSSNLFKNLVKISIVIDPDHIGNFVDFVPSVREQRDRLFDAHAVVDVDKIHAGFLFEKL